MRARRAFDLTLNLGMIERSGGAALPDGGSAGCPSRWRSRKSIAIMFQAPAGDFLFLRLLTPQRDAHTPGAGDVGRFDEQRYRLHRRAGSAAVRSAGAGRDGRILVATSRGAGNRARSQPFRSSSNRETVGSMRKNFLSMICVAPTWSGFAAAQSGPATVRQPTSYRLRRRRLPPIMRETSSTPSAATPASNAMPQQRSSCPVRLTSCAECC